jgi:MFS family permease
MKIPGGWCADRFGAKTGLIWSGLLLSLLTFLVPQASHLGPEYLVGLRLVGGLANVKKKLKKKGFLQKLILYF